MTSRTLFAALAACALAGATNANAQTIGFKAGASLADWSAGVAGFGLGTDPVASFTGGGFVRFGFGPVGIQPELLVVTRGTAFQAGGLADARFRVDYVELPLLLVLRIGQSGSVAPYLFGGPSMALEIGCRAEASTGGFQVSGDCDDVPDAGVLDRKRLDTGLTAGAGLEFPLGFASLLVEGRFNWGVTDLSDFPGLEVKSRTGALLAGVSIPLGAGR
jgi:hypothetical protein